MASAQSVLVVDDDPDLREGLCTLLGKRGFCVLAASNGVEALELLQSRPEVALVLMDLMMPTMNGWELRKAMAQDRTLAAIPVIVMSARQDLAKEAGELDVQGWFCKPLSFSALLACVETNLASVDSGQ